MLCLNNACSQARKHSQASSIRFDQNSNAVKNNPAFGTVKYTPTKLPKIRNRPPIDNGHPDSMFSALLPLRCCTTISQLLVFWKRFFSKRRLCVTPSGLKMIIRLTQGFATLTLGFYVASPLGRQYDAHQPPSTTSTQSTTSTTAAKRQKPGGRHIKAQGKPGRQARRSPGGDGI